MNDYISRQTVLRCIKESRDGIDWGQSEDGDAFLHYSAALYRTVACKECLPAADVVPVVHGEWEDKEVIHKRCIEEWQSARCSACEKYHTTPYMYYFDDFKFCPNCGAKMVE